MGTGFRGWLGGSGGIPRVDKEVDDLFHGFLGLAAQGAVLGRCWRRGEVGWEEGQLAALRLGDPGLCAGGMVVQHGLRIVEAVGRLLLVF